MKLRYLAIAAACAAVSGHAMALDKATTIAVPAANQLYIAGSSALQKVIEGVLSQNCAAGTFTNFKSLAASFPPDTSNGNSYNIYSCTLNAVNDFGNLAGNIAVYKREAGGSAQGVFPVAFPAANAAQIKFLDINSCTDGANTCTSVITNRAPDAGVSDLEPVAFNFTVNQPTAFAGQKVINSNFDAVKPPKAVAVQVFGLIVNDGLYADLQADQGLPPSGQPSVSSAAFTTLYLPGFGLTGLGWTPLLKTGAKLQSQVNICSRVLGSGTRATAQVQFLQSPYNALASAFAVPSIDNTPGAIKGASTVGNYFVSDESTAGNVGGCVALANASGGYSVGITSTDRVAPAGTKFVKLDNQIPSAQPAAGPTAQDPAQARNGEYPWVFESFYQINKTAPSLALARLFGTAFAKPDNIFAAGAGANAPTLNGIMATPENCSGAIYTDWVSAAERTVCSRVSRQQDSRTPLVFIK